MAIKNPCGKTRPKDDPYEVWESTYGWKWSVLKKYQTPENEAKNPYARWFCLVETPFAPGGDMGDVYVKDVTRHARRVR